MNGTVRQESSDGFTTCLAGGCFKSGFAYGSTDEFWYKAIENRVSMHDLQAIWLHLRGLNHVQLTYRYAGRDFRLTDVRGSVVRDIIR
jgi:hypothetical protein